MRTSLLIVFAWTVGCLNPDDRLTLSGRVKAADPTEGQVVRLLRARGAPPNECDPSSGETFRTTTVDADGGYRFELYRVEAQALTGVGQFCFRVETTFASGSRSWTDERYMNQPLRVATLREWRSGLELDGGRLHFEPVVPWPEERIELDDAGRPRVGVQLSHRLEVRTAAGALIWREDDRFWSRDSGTGYSRSGLEISPFELEDFEGSLALIADLNDAETRMEGIYDARLPSVRITSDRTLALRGETVPLSRGVPCPDLGSPCPLTDGRVEPVDGGLMTDVTLDLGVTRSIHAVVIRGGEVAVGGGTPIEVRLERADGGSAFEQTLQTELSAYDDPPRALVLPDGGYRNLKTIYAVLQTDGDVEAQRVLVRFGDGLTAAQEISVF